MKELQMDLNIIYGAVQELELIEKVLLEHDLDKEVKDLIKVKHALNEKFIEINNKIYEENKKAR